MEKLNDHDKKTPVEAGASEAMRSQTGAWERGKYLLNEKAEEGYVVVFDVKTKMSKMRVPRKRMVEGKEISKIMNYLLAISQSE